MFETVADSLRSIEACDCSDKVGEYKRVLEEARVANSLLNVAIEEAARSTRDNTTIQNAFDSVADRFGGARVLIPTYASSQSLATIQDLDNILGYIGDSKSSASLDLTSNAGNVVGNLTSIGATGIAAGVFIGVVQEWKYLQKNEQKTVFQRSS